MRVVVGIKVLPESKLASFNGANILLRIEKVNYGSPLTLTLSPQAGRGDTPSPARAGEGWGEGGRC